MKRTIAPWLPLLATLAAACGPAATPAPSAAPAAAPPAAPAAGVAADPAMARRATDVTLAALSRRSFDVAGCAAAEARVVPEAEARAGAAAGDRCLVLVARKADESWLVVVRSALSSKSYGAQALVTVAPGAEGITAVEYAR
ncbi:MAG: hypothetical protein IT372_41730 [Polyangiaceae bacterium]|nr:hypothetical protein [Polyangiaceae bacterium]